MTNESINGEFTDKAKLDPDFYATTLALCTEMTDFTKRALEMRLAFAGKILGASSLNNAFEAQSEYANTYFQEGLAQATKIGEIYSNLAKSAFKPMADESV
jgi:hypothetical protein